MADTSRVALLNVLVACYTDLKRRLTRRLGSAELAAEALQDTFLRLKCAGEVGDVRSPHAYLFRVAVSVAADRRVVESRSLTVSETEALLDFVDDTPGPARVIEGRSDFDALKRAVGELPARRREILIAACMEELPYRAIAARFGISVRTVQVEIKQALKHCALRLDRNAIGRASPRSRRLSFDYGPRQDVIVDDEATAHTALPNNHANDIVPWE
jgi:RNA polymerase sigma factor (sigma-70 family)